MDLSTHFKQATDEISRGMKPGAYAKLKEKYPNRLEKIEYDLSVNFTEKQIDEYKKSIVAGFQKIKMWDNERFLKEGTI